MWGGAAVGTVSVKKLLRNWGWVYLGNLIGSLLYAALFYLAITNWRTGNGSPETSGAKENAGLRSSGGASGWATALVKGILCNWIATVGALLALASRSTVGKIAAMWLSSP